MYTKEQVLKRAREAGSRANSVSGACRYLAARLQPARLGYSPARRQRDAQAKDDYLYGRRGKRICQALGLPMDYMDRADAAVATAPSLDAIPSLLRAEFTAIYEAECLAASCPCGWTCQQCMRLLAIWPTGRKAKAYARWLREVNGLEARQRSAQ